MKKRLSTSIIQKHASCILISPVIILNCLTGVSGDDLFNYFLDEHIEIIKRGFNQGTINPILYQSQTPEGKFGYLNTKANQILGGNFSFNNEYVANFFKRFANENKLAIEYISIKDNIDRIENILIKENAFLSYSYPEIGVGYHAIPIGYSSEFYSIEQRQGVILSHGDSILNIKSNVCAADIGDGILIREYN